MTLAEIIGIAEAWAQLGWSIQAQAKDVLIEGADYNDQNPNALKYIIQWLETVFDATWNEDTGLEADHWIATLKMHLEGCFNEPGNWEPDCGRE